MNKFRNMKRFLFGTMAVFLIGTAHAQQVPLISQHQLNPFIYNPSYAGLNGATSLMVHYREQWKDIPGSPVTGLISLEGPVKDNKVGLGLIATSDRTNIINRTSFMGTYAYRFNLNENQFISLGLSMGFNQNTIDFAGIKATDAGDPGLFNSLESGTNFDANFGMTYGFHDLRIGATTNQLLNSGFNLVDQSNNEFLSYQFIRHFLVTATYKFSFSDDKMAFIPNVAIRTAQGLPIQYEAGGLFNYLDKAWLGAVYRQGSAVAIQAGVFAYNKFTIGYSYDLALGSVSPYTNGSHEIMVGYRFGKAGKQQPSESNFGTKKLDKKVVELSLKQSEEIDKLKSENETLNRKVEKNETTITGLKEEIERLKKAAVNENDSNLSRIIASHLANLDKVEKTDDGDKKVEDINDQVFKDKYYVVMGVYYNLKDAISFQKILEREIDLETGVFQRDDGKYFFVYSKGLNNKDEVKNEFKRLKKLNIEKYTYGHIWVYEK